MSTGFYYVLVDTLKFSKYSLSSVIIHLYRKLTLNTWSELNPVIAKFNTGQGCIGNCMSYFCRLNMVTSI